MPNAEKTAAVAELTDAFQNSTGAVLTEYRGLSVAALSELRRALADNARYTVVKNTLTMIAAERAGIAEVTGPLSGPTAIAFVTGDPVAVAKSIRDFARTNPHLVVKGGLLEGRALSADEIRRLADLESRDVLLAMLAGALNASLARAAGLFAAPLSQAARLTAALRDARSAEQPPAEQPPAEQPAADGAVSTG